MGICICCTLDSRKHMELCWKYSWKIIVPLAIVTAAIVVVFSTFIIHRIEAIVEDARLNSFAYGTTADGRATTSFFTYNISVAVTVRNPNWSPLRIEYTEPLVASIVFHDRRLYNVSVAEKGHKHSGGKTEVYRLQTGKEVPSYVLGTDALEEFKKQNATGVFKVDVLLSGEIMYMGIVNILAKKKDKLGLSCSLSLQLAPPGPEVIVFREVNCNRDKRQKIYY